MSILRTTYNKDCTIKTQLEIVPCPACGAASFLSEGLDRFLHVNGSSNQRCWAHISSGAEGPLPPEDPLAFLDNVEIPGRKVVTVRGSDVQMQPIVWWEPGIVLAAAINLLAGREGKGKSTVAAAWAAKETRDGGTVMWLGTEESREHAQAPRLVAAGADMDRIVFVDVENTGPTKVLGPLQFPLDLPALERTIVEHNVTMIVMDPCKGLVPSDFRGNDDVAVRQYLEPIAALCARRNIVMIGLMHFGKREDNDSGKLILGSVAWSQVARSVISIAEDPEADTRVITNTKTNYSPEARSLEFRIVNQDVVTEGGISTLGAVEWLGETTKDARDLLGSNDDPDERTACEYWLEDFLIANGRTKSTEVKAAGGKEGFTERTLQRAKKNLGITDISEGFPRTTFWELPQSRQSGHTPLKHGATVATGATEPDQQEHDGGTGVESAVTPVATPPCIYGTTVTTGVATGGVTDKTPGQTDRVKAALAKAQQNLGPPCDVCGEPVTAGQGTTHLSCKGATE